MRQRKPVPTKAIRLDDIHSALSGVGTLARDPRMSTTFQKVSTGIAEARVMWASNYLAAIGIESIVDDAMREGYELRVKVPGLGDSVKSTWEDLGVDQTLRDALCYERAYGGGAILMGVEDGAQNMTEPVRMDRVRGAGVNWLTSIEPDELTPEEMQNDPGKPGFGKVAIWRLKVNVGPGRTRDELVHASRLVIFDGIKVSKRSQNASLRGWGDSVLSRCRTVMINYLNAMSAAGILLSDFAPLVYKVEGWADMVGQGQAGIVKGLVEALMVTQSTLNAQIVDAKGDVERKVTPVSGMPELLGKLQQEVAAAFRIPVTRLMGQAPAGLSATGDSDMRNYLDEVKAFQARKMRPAIERVTKLLLLARGAEPDNWTIAFRSLWQTTEKEKAETRLVQAQADSVYIDAGVVSSEEVARSRFAGDEERFTMSIDFDARSRFEELASSEPQADDTVDAQAAAPAETMAASQSLNGAQVASLIEVMVQYNEGKISRINAIGVLALAFGMSEPEASSALGGDPIAIASTTPAAKAPGDIA